MIILITSNSTQNTDTIKSVLPNTDSSNIIQNEKSAVTSDMLNDDTKEFKPEELVHPEQVFDFEFLENDDD